MDVTDKNHDVYKTYPILLNIINELSFKGCLEKTISNYIDGIRRFLEFCGVTNEQIQDLTEDDIRRYLEHLKYTLCKSPSTINCNNSYLRFFFQSTLGKPINLHRIPMLKAVKKEPLFLYPDQVQRLIDISSENWCDTIIIKLGICAGLRIDEVANLKVSDIDVEHRVLHVRQSKRLRDRTVPIDNTLYEALHYYSLERHLKRNCYLIYFRRGGADKASCETIRRHFYAYRNRLGLSSEYTFHALRHTYATLFLMGSHDVVRLMHLMGHSSLESTSRYVHVVDRIQNNEDSVVDRIMGGKFNG